MDEWTFAVSWDPKAGSIPTPILRLFRPKDTITPGYVAKVTDKGHAAYYERAVKQWLTKYASQRDDITVTIMEGH